MKKIIAASIVCAVMFCVSCADEGFVKVFECDENYPYFSGKNHLCYESEQAREDAEKVFDEAQEAANSESENENTEDATPDNDSDAE